MKTVSLSGSLRENVGKKDAKTIRNLGHVPCVLYGGKEQIHFSMDERNFKELVFRPEVCFVDFDISEKKFSAILQDIQYHPISDKIVHADFLELIGKPIKMEVPIKLEGVSPGVLEGGRLALKYRKIPIKSLPGDMPENIVISIDSLNIGDNVKASQVKSDKYEVLFDENTMLVMILKARAAEELAVEEGVEEATEEGGEKPAESGEKSTETT